MAALVGGLDFDELYPGRFIRPSDLKGQEWTGTITAVRMEELIGKTGKRMKPILTFREATQELVLNRTNGECVKAMFGRNTAAWIGRRVTLFSVPYEGSEALRVKGSPDIESTTDIVVELPGKNPFKMTMHRTTLLIVETSSRRVDEDVARARQLVSAAGNKS